MTHSTTTPLNADIRAMADFLKKQGYQLDVTNPMFPLRIVCPDQGGIAGLRFQHGKWTYLLYFDDCFQPGEKQQISLHLQQAIQELKK